MQIPFLNYINILTISHLTFIISSRETYTIFKLIKNGCDEGGIFTQ
jgi:hypothetical protein